jgi:hypothetical protein
MLPVAIDGVLICQEKVMEIYLVTYSISRVRALFCFGASFDKEATEVRQIRRLYTLV